VSGAKSGASAPTEKFCQLAIRAVPNSPRSEVVGWLDGALKIKIHAPALEGRANEALTEFIAEIFGRPRRAVTLLRGDKSRHKIVRIAGLDLAEVQQRVTALITQPNSRRSF
jgi:uncharacterized protein (TIGR00251 family)